MISVVLIERIPAGAAASDATLDQVVDALIAMRGIDLRLVPGLPAIGEDLPTTMTLETISGPVVLLGWQSASQLFDAWAVTGLSGARTRHSLDAQGPVAQPGQRSVFAINLCDGHPVSAVADTIQKLDRSASTPVATLSINGPSETRAVSSAIPESAVIPKTIANADARPESASKTMPQPPAQPPPPPALPSPQTASPSEGQLDAWVDDLDEFDRL